MGEDSKTLKLILEAAEREFLEKGFQNASLRNIVKTVGVTTGAFYRYYPTKEALFEAMVKPHAEMILNYFSGAVENLESMSAEEQSHNMTVSSYNCVDEMLDYVYANYNSFKLLLCSAYGTPYENFIHELVEREVESTVRYAETLRSLGNDIPELDMELCHMLSSGFFTGIFEMIIHDMAKEEAKRRVHQIHEFYSGGWERIMGVKFD